ncbi:Valine--pyruvate aminotransferase [hydrothermal vent metagenome]|uniref:Valine--pyruvate aminotransferase n=1 Tax=hydrothermal vent metagenome TaxID=652676 RepID=A0A3B0TET5_9ZZZZ
MTPRLSFSARGNVDPFLAMDVLARANAAQASGRDILHLEVGQPGGQAPACVLEAARVALDHERIGYTQALGRPSLRARIARHYGEVYGVDLDPGRVVVTTGSSAGFVLSYLAAFDAGARVGIAEPGYPANRNILKSLDLVPVGLRVGPQNRWQPTVADLQALTGADRLDGLLIASPANPTGTMVTRDAFAGLIGHCAENGIWFLSDEIYHGLTYGEAAATALEFSSEVIVINSFSKYYCMTGWRIGWLVVPEALVRVVERLAQNLFISPPTLSQFAAEAAFDACDELEARKSVYAGNRDVLAGALKAGGQVEIAPPDGAFYLYADMRRFTNDSQGLARAMLEETGVAATPGLDFDPVDGGLYLRFSFAEDPAVIARAADKLHRWLAYRALEG